MPKRILRGTVVSTKNEKTAIVQVVRQFMHPLYKKSVKRSKKFAAHDEQQCTVGQEVRIEESRPISKTKRWKVLEIVQD